MSTEALNAVNTMLADPAPATETQAPAAEQQPTTEQNAQQPQAQQAPAATESEAVTMPGKDATPEQWAEFYAKLRPESPDAYELPIPEGDDGAFAKQAAEWLHDSGLSKEQAGKLAGKWNEFVSAQQQAQQAEAEAQAQEQHAKNMAEQGELQKEWGQQFDANMHQARMAVQQFLPKEQAGDIIGAIESKIGYKATIQFLQNIGMRLGEHDAAGLGQNTSGAQQKSLAQRMYPNMAQ